MSVWSFPARAGPAVHVGPLKAAAVAGVAARRPDLAGGQRRDAAQGVVALRDRGRVGDLGPPGAVPVQDEPIRPDLGVRVRSGAFAHGPDVVGGEGVDTVEEAAGAANRRLGRRHVGPARAVPAEGESLISGGAIDLVHGVVGAHGPDVVAGDHLHVVQEDGGAGTRAGCRDLGPARAIPVQREAAALVRAAGCGIDPADAPGVARGDRVDAVELAIVAGGRGRSELPLAGGGEGNGGHAGQEKAERQDESRKGSGGHREYSMEEGPETNRTTQELRQPGAFGWNSRSGRTLRLTVGATAVSGGLLPEEEPCADLWCYNIS